MIVYDKEGMASSQTGCYPTLGCLYSMIPREVRLHMERVGIYAEYFYEYLYKNYYEMVEEFGENFHKNVRALYTLHDIGRAFVPVRFQNKAGGLTDEEYAQIKRHTTLTPDTLDSIYRLDFPIELLMHLNNIALCHHERWGGGGYPFGITQTAIPLEARICSLADTYDGMTSWKPYRKGMPMEKVKKVFEEEAGKQFQPELVYAFLECMEGLPNDLGAEWEGTAGRYFGMQEQTGRYKGWREEK